MERLERRKAVSGFTPYPDSPPLVSITITPSLLLQETHHFRTQVVIPGPAPSALVPAPETSDFPRPCPLLWHLRFLQASPRRGPVPNPCNLGLFLAPPCDGEAHPFLPCPSPPDPAPWPHLEFSYGEAATVPLLGAKAVERAADENGHSGRR